jgi:heparan-alpha-glucosaminide N-acetyltransferase
MTGTNTCSMASHWNKNSNLGQAFDLRFLNLFPRTSRFLFNDGGYLTLSFIPTLGTMLLGLATGRWLIADPSTNPNAEVPDCGRRTDIRRPRCTSRGLSDRQASLDAVMDTLQRRNVFSFSGRVLMDCRYQKQTSFAFPLVVVGMNSIAAYLMAHL